MIIKRLTAQSRALKSQPTTTNKESKMTTVQTYSNKENKELAITIKALRSSFNKIKDDLMKESYMSDDYLIQQVRRLQDEYKLFGKLVDSLKERDEEMYKKEILG